MIGTTFKEGGEETAGSGRRRQVFGFGGPNRLWVRDAAYARGSEGLAIN